MRIAKFTSVARILDPRYSTNLAIGLITIAVGALTFFPGLFNGDSFVESLIRGILNAGAVFAAWAISREIDPDHEYSAFVAVGIAIPLVWVVDDALQLLPLAWLVLAIRTINRTTGFAPTLFDSLAVLALGVWLGFAESWAYLATTVLALVLVGVSPTLRRRSLGLTAIAGILAVPAYISDNASLEIEFALLALGISALFVPVIVSSRTPISSADYSGFPLEGKRVQLGQSFALAAGTLVAAWGGLVDLVPLWAATLGVSLYWAIAVIRQHWPSLMNSA